MYPPYDLISNFDFHVLFVFLAVILVPELFRKLRETPGKNSHQVWSKSERSCMKIMTKKIKNKDFLDFYFPRFIRWGLFSIIFDLRFGFCMSKSSPGTPPNAWKLRNCKNS